MNKILDTKTLLKIAALVMAVFCFTTPFADHPHLSYPKDVWLGLDVSWQVMLGYALNKHWQWGTDIIYTYGPLGVLATRAGMGISRWVFLLFDFYLICNFYFLFKDFLLNATEKFIALLVVFAITLLLDTNIGGDLSWVITVFSFYWMYKSYQEPRYVYFLLSVLNIVLCFYIKLNAGIIGFFFLFAHLANLLMFKKIRLPKVAVILAIGIALIYTGALLFNVNILSYTVGAFEIIKGYNDVMFLPSKGYERIEHNVNMLFVAIMLLYGIYVLLVGKERKFSLLFFACISFAYIFLLRKQAILRNDPIHYFEFYKYAPIVFLSGAFALIDKKYQKFTYAASLIVVLYSLFLMSEHPYRHIDDAFKNRYFSAKDYLQQFGKYNSQTRLEGSKIRALPQAILQRIGNQSVDIFPWDSEIVIENGLNYKPRPVFQSFSAYTERLQRKNYEFYIKTPPEYIIYNSETIDDRYAMNDDFLVNLFICKNYTFADSFTSGKELRLLLQKKAVTSPLIEVITKEVKTKINEDIPVEWVMTMKVDVKYSFAGKLQSILNRPPLIGIEMTDMNNHKRFYKISVELLKCGIFLDRWIANANGFETYLRDKNMLDVFKTVVIKADEQYFEKELNIKYINYK